MKRKSTIFAMLFLLCAAFASLHAQTVIGGTTPDNSAMLDVQSTSKGVLFPRMTTAERDAIASPASGLIIFNSETTCLEINLGTETASWQPIKCAIGELPSIDCAARVFNNFPLTPGTPATNQSISISYSGGNGLSYEGQTVASTGVTGLTATLAAGNFANGAGTLTYTLSGTPSGYGTASFVISIDDQSCTLEVPLCGAYGGDGSVWKVFSCYNLGAVGATDGTDPMTPNWKLNGDYYMWGNETILAQGPSDANTPNDAAPANWANFTPGEEDDWTDYPAAKGAKDPCPDGFRVPSQMEWEEVAEHGTISYPPGATWTEGVNNYDSGTFLGPSLFLPASGGRSTADTGLLFARNAFGYYWTSTRAGSSLASAAESSRTEIFLFPANLSDGFSVRCIAEEPTN